MIHKKIHVHPCEVTYDLLDADQVVYHPNYLVILDRARIEALKNAGCSFMELRKEGFSLVLRENTSEYFKPLLMDQKVFILTQTEEISASSLFITQKVVSSDFFPNGIPQEKFIDAFPIDPKKVIHQTRFRLVSVTIDPLRATRHPERLVQCLKLDQSV